MSIKKSVRLKQHGDTIVEVMIVLAVLGLALGISYRTATRSLLAVREAQENSEATQLLQSQVEGLYNLAPSATQNIFQTSKFCIDTASNTVTTTPPFACVQGIYSISIIYCNTNTLNPLCAGHPNDDTFVLTAIWQNVRGQGNDRIALTYRVRKL